MEKMRLAVCVALALALFLLLFAAIPTVASLPAPGPDCAAPRGAPREEPELIFVCLGNMQDYLLVNLKHVRAGGHETITVICDAHLAKQFDGFGVNIVLTSALDLYGFALRTELPSGFWQLCSKRLFCLCAYIKQFQRWHCFHAENDVLLYCVLSEVNVDRKRVYIVADNDYRVVPSLIYLPDPDCLLPLVSDYQHSENDMINLKRFADRHPSRVRLFPVLPPCDAYPEDTVYTEAYGEFKMIFDAAAMGQFLGGLDPQHSPGDTRGFVNTDAIHRFDGFEFGWFSRVLPGRPPLLCPWLQVDRVWIPIANLHIHCKRLEAFSFLASDQLRVNAG